MAAAGHGNGKNGQWKQEELEHAVCEVILDQRPVREAARKWSVPRTTLARYLKDLPADSVASLRVKRDRAEGEVLSGSPFNDEPVLKKRIMGHPVTLAEAEEDRILQMVHAMEERFLPYSKRTLTDLANRTLRQRTGGKGLRCSPILGDGWCRGFLARHPEVSLHTPNALSADRCKQTTEEALEPHLTCLKAVLERSGLLDRPGRIWNADETGIQLGQTGGRTKVIASRGARRVYVRSSPDTRHVSLLFAVNAAGQCSPATFILPTAKTPAGFWQAIDLLDEDDWAAVCEKKGFITEASFYGWLKLFVQHLDENIRQNNVNEEHLLIIDQCSSHSSLRILEYAEQHSVMLYALPPHTTHLTQPVDVGLFGPFKTHYRTAENMLMVNRDNWPIGLESRKPVLRTVSMDDIPTIVHWALQQAFTIQNVESAFRATGIYPYHREALLAQVGKHSERPEESDDDGMEDQNDDEDDKICADDNPLTESEARALQAQRILREPSKRIPYPKVPLVGLLRSKDYKAALEAGERAAQAKAKDKQEQAEQKKQRKAAQLEEKARSAYKRLARIHDARSTKRVRRKAGQKKNQELTDARPRSRRDTSATANRVVNHQGRRRLSRLPERFIE